MSNAFYYSKEHISLKDNPKFIGIDIDWYLSAYTEWQQSIIEDGAVPVMKFSEFVANELKEK